VQSLYCWSWCFTEKLALSVDGYIARELENINERW
jgi:hypothetical protein